MFFLFLINWLSNTSENDFFYITSLIGASQFPLSILILNNNNMDSHQKCQRFTIKIPACNIDSHPCKSFEHVMSSKIWEHLNKHHIITKKHGFCGGMSCEAQLIESINYWSQLLHNSPGQIDVILLDIYIN